MILFKLSKTVLFPQNNTRKHETVPSKQSSISKQLSDKFGFETEVVLKKVLLFAYFHAAALYGGYLFLFVCTWKTFFWSILLMKLAGLGITAGAHRLWAHRSYKAKLPLRIILMIFQSMAFQMHIYEWARDHRVHHKYAHTNADPHNPERGYLFTHIGWLMMKRHEDVLVKGKGVDISDVEADSVVRFQKRYYAVLVALICFILPAVVPRYFWKEDWWVCCFTPTFFRFVVNLNSTLLINSLAHAYGSRPYDKHIGPADNILTAYLTLGEGWHNYHHVFPWDYKTAELGRYDQNFTKMIIDFFSWIGWAYDLKTASVELVTSRMKRTGDSSGIYTYKYPYDHHHYQDGLWGWDDADMKAEEREKVKIYKRERK